MLELQGIKPPSDGAAWDCSAVALEGEYDLTLWTAYIRGESRDDPRRCNASAVIILNPDVSIPKEWSRVLCEDHVAELSATNERVCRDCSNAQRYDSDTGEPHGRHGRCFTCDWTFSDKSDLEDEEDD